MQDLSDIQWRGFREGLPQAAAAMAVFAIGSQTVCQLISQPCSSFNACGGSLPHSPSSSPCCCIRSAQAATRALRVCCTMSIKLPSLSVSGRSDALGRQLASGSA